MQVTEHEIRVTPQEAEQMLASLAPLRSSRFIDAVLGKIEAELPQVLSGEKSNFYVSIEIYDY